MSSNPRRRLVALATLFAERFPDLVLETEVHARHLWVDGQLITKPNTRVRAGAGLRLRRRRKLRGSVKLDHALEVFDVRVRGRLGADIGAAAGGFTTALLDAGAARVYAIDTAVGQLTGRLRSDPHVVNLEGHNLGSLTRRDVPEPIEVVTVDLSYLSLARAISQLDDALEIAPGADLIALVKPTFELRAGTLAATDEEVRTAVATARSALADARWRLLETSPAPRTGRRGAVEVFVHARRTA